MVFCQDLVQAFEDVFIVVENVPQRLEVAMAVSANAVDAYTRKHDERYETTKNTKQLKIRTTSRANHDTMITNTQPS